MRNILFSICLFSAVVIMLPSCETFIQSQGTVRDKLSGKPVSEVNVKLLWYRRQDTMVNSGFVVDSLPYDKRRKARKQGVADNCKVYDFGSNKWARPAPVFTDTSGKFSTGKFWASAIFGVPKVSVLLTKHGYKTLLLSPNSRYGSVFYMEKEN